MTQHFCNVCFKTANCKNAIVSHLKIVHGKVGKFTTQHLCRACLLSFPNQESFLRHSMSEHKVDSDDGKMKCSYCNVFESANILETKEHFVIVHRAREIACRDNIKEEENNVFLEADHKEEEDKFNPDRRTTRKRKAEKEIKKEKGNGSKRHRPNNVSNGDVQGNYTLLPWQGSNDNLIKVFNVNLGLLKITYRDHASEIADITSTDKVVRVWKLKNGGTTSLFKCDQVEISPIRFLPFVESGNNRYLVTTGNDCIINFHMFNQETLEFPPGSASIAFTRNEGDQRVEMIGYRWWHVLVAGESLGTLRVYRVQASGLIAKANDSMAHTNRVDSLMWANRGMKFASRSNDVLIWRYQFTEWSETALALCQISIICWMKDDSYLITTGSDYSFRVWDATDGSQLYKLSFHSDDIYHLLPHPIHPHIIFSAGYDTAAKSVSFWDLFNLCNDEFCVSSGAALRQQLVEFCDHRLIFTRRGNDCNEKIYATADRVIIDRFLKSVNKLLVEMQVDDEED